jgi:hypothetical protein
MAMRMVPPPLNRLLAGSFSSYTPVQRQIQDAASRHAGIGRVCGDSGSLRGSTEEEDCSSRAQYVVLWRRISEEEELTDDESRYEDSDIDFVMKTLTAAGCYRRPMKTMLPQMSSSDTENDAAPDVMEQVILPQIFLRRSGVLPSLNDAVLEVSSRSSTTIPPHQQVRCYHVL